MIDPRGSAEAVGYAGASTSFHYVEVGSDSWRFVFRSSSLHLCDIALDQVILRRWFASITFIC